MYIKRLRLENVRNHRHSQFDLSPGINIFFGKNGAGKTSILECVSVLCLTKSFLPVNDWSLVRSGENNYKLSCESLTGLGTPFFIKAIYERGKRKRFESSVGDNLSPKDIIGEIPIVVLWPESKSITIGSPSDRRVFIDRILCQIWKSYLEGLMKLRKSIRQRNKILQFYKSNSKIPSISKMESFGLDELESWTEIFINTSANIIEKRVKFVNEFKPYFQNSYNKISNGNEIVNIEYKPDGINVPPVLTSLPYEKIIEKYFDIYRKIRNTELKRGQTLFGPQKDELWIEINGGQAKEFASQGQHKTLLISLKFAEFNYLKSIKQETPVLLLDDIFSELDAERSNKVMELVFDNYPQTFITMTDIDFIKRSGYITGDSSFFYVSDGKVELVNNL